MMAMNDLVTRAGDLSRRLLRFVLHDVWALGTPGEKLPRGPLTTPKSLA